MRGETVDNRRTLPHRRHFNPLPSCEGRRRRLCGISRRGRISIHSPHARGDQAGTDDAQRAEFYFNPLPSCEGRQAKPGYLCFKVRFQSTPLMRGETVALSMGTDPVIFQSTPLMRGETMLRRLQRLLASHFNPLPSCEGRRSFSFARLCSSCISIHSPHARGDPR